MLIFNAFERKAEEQQILMISAIGVRNIYRCIELNTNSQNRHSAERLIELALFRIATTACYIGTVFNCYLSFASFLYVSYACIIVVIFTSELLV